MSLHYTQSSSETGKLQISVISRQSHTPIPNATINISYTDKPDNIIEQIVTDSSGVTEAVNLVTPPLEYSFNPDSPKPYSEYNITVTASGFESVFISGVELLGGVKALQNIEMLPVKRELESEEIIILPHTLYAEYPPKIAEAEIKPINKTGEIVLSSVVVPEYIVVHEGPPTDSSAQNHYVRYKDYIKNVASSEIYATWPKATLRANILAIMSFTLNRVYTEWYRNKGYNFTITSSTAHDHKWIRGRNVFDTISEVTDELFGSFLSRPNVKQPILAQYCDGKRVNCPNWMSQWGSQALGEKGHSEIEILRNFYGDNMYINVTEEISGVPSSWPGYDLTIGASGDKVRHIQEEQNAIAQVYTVIPKITADGIYGLRTGEAVSAFQKVFGLPQTGVVNYSTWYKISEIYVAISRIAELN